MKVIKIIRQEYEVENASAKPFMKFGAFRATREKLGLSVIMRCFNCGHKFKDKDDTYLILFKNAPNQLFCKNCNDNALEDLRKEVRNESD